MKDTHSLKILIAEDNPMEQATLQKMLENLGCRVCAVGTGQKAVKEFVTQTFDLVLLDIMMPEMDGFAAARLIRAREQATGDNTPLVALTSCSLNEIETRCHEADMDGYLAKPVENDKLISMLKHLGLIHPATAPAQGDAHLENLASSELVVRFANIFTNNVLFAMIAPNHMRRRSWHGKHNGLHWCSPMKAENYSRTFPVQ